MSIAVADERVGIPAEDLPHVFGSFYRARRDGQPGAVVTLRLPAAP